MKTDCRSIGQYAALVTAGVLCLRDALKIVAFRARLMIERCPLAATGMLAVNRNANDIQSYISNHPAYHDLSIACCNSPDDCVVGGPLGPLGALKDDLKANHKYKVAMLSNPMAYHTNAMDAILNDLTKVASSVEWSTPKVPVICNVLGRVVAKDEASYTADFPARHCRQTVLFDRGIGDFLSGNNAEQVIWIEIGPHPSIIPMVKSQASDKHHSFIPSMRKSIDPWDTLSEAQSQLYRSSIPINWRNTFSASPSPKCTLLPSYQFDYTDFLVEYPRESTEHKVDPQHPSTGYDFLVRQCETSSSSARKEIVFETPIENLAQYIVGHIVCGFALCPASVYHEMVLAAAEVFEKRETASNNNETSSHVNILSKIAYLNPLLYVEGSQSVIRTTISCADRYQNDTQGFVVSSYRPSSPKDITNHCQGFLKRQPRPSEENRFTVLQAQLQKPMSLMESMESIEVFRTRAIYDKLFPRVVTYSKMYQAVQSMSISTDGTEALATVEIPAPKATTKAKFAVNPVFMDVILHVAGFVANLAAGQDDALICKESKSTRVIMDQSDVQKPIKIYCSNTNVGDGIVGNGYAMGSSGQLLAVFKGMHFTRVKLKAVEASFKHVSSEDHPPRRDKEAARSKEETHSTHQPVEDSSRKTTDRRASQAKSLSTINPKVIVAEVCGVAGTSLSSESDLEGLGIDSLMILELGSRIQEAVAATITSQELNACVTVKDIEALVASKTMEIPRLREDPASSGPPPQKRHDTTQLRTSGPSIASTIVEICGVDPNNITTNTKLESLGIDSLMIFELEDKLKEIYSVTLDGNALASCKTVGDIDSLVGQDKGSDDVQSPQFDDGTVRPKLEERASTSSEASQVLSDSMSGLSTPPTRTASSSPPGPEPSTLPDNPVKLSSLEDPLSLIQLGRQGSSAEPLILIHDGSGLSIPYRSIGDLDRPLWGMSNPKTFGTDTWTDLDAMAQAYAAKIFGNIKGPVILGGKLIIRLTPTNSID